MNVAENVANSEPVKPNHPRSARLVQTEVKPFPFKEGKNVMEKGIVIGKLHHRPDRNHQDVGLETLVLLHQPRVCRRGWGGRWGRLRPPPPGCGARTSCSSPPAASLPAGLAAPLWSLRLPLR